MEGSDFDSRKGKECLFLQVVQADSVAHSSCFQQFPRLFLQDKFAGT
jgi:hypothetical protein